MLSREVRNKWTLLVRTLPVVAMSLTLRYVATEVLDMHLTLTFSDLAPLLTGASVILGLMLAGVIADYKEAEKLPAAVARALNDLDGLSRRGLHRMGKDASNAHDRVLALTDTIDDWIYLRVNDDEVWAARSDMGEMILDLDNQDVPEHYLHRLLRVNSDLGAALSRIQVIRNTDFISAGYALMQLLVGGIVLSLSIVVFSSPLIGFGLTAGLSLLYSYLVLLAKYIDNPFMHGMNLGKGSVADVDLDPFHDVQAKLREAAQARSNELGK